MTSSSSHTRSWAKTNYSLVSCVLKRNNELEGRIWKSKSISGANQHSKELVQSLWAEPWELQLWSAADCSECSHRSLTWLRAQPRSSTAGKQPVGLGEQTAGTERAQASASHPEDSSNTKIPASSLNLWSRRISASRNNLNCDLFNKTW